MIAVMGIFGRKQVDSAHGPRQDRQPGGEAGAEDPESLLPRTDAEAALPPLYRRALLDARWEETAGFRQMARRHTNILVIAVLATIMCVFSIVMTVQQVVMPLLGYVVSTAAFLVGYVGFLYVLWDRARRRRQFQALVAVDIADQIQERERDLAESGEPLSLAELWSVTQERIEYYHKIVTTQSEVSFRNGAITSYLGLGLLLALAVVAIFTGGDLATSVVIGVLGAIGAALSGFLGATFIKLHTEASAQLREFFSQPVEFSRLLGAERLIESLPPSERAESVQLVIRAMMQSRDAGPDGSL